MAHAQERPLVLVVDDHPLVREALVHALEGPLQDLACIAVGSAGQALQQLHGLPHLAAVLADHRLPDGDGVSLLLEVRRLRPSTACVLLSGMEDPRLPARARHLGFDGYLSKSMEPLQIVAGVRAVLQGRPCFPAPSPAAGLPALTDRQAEVLTLVGQGRSNKEIARALGVTERTVKDHLTIVFARLAVNTRTEAVARAATLGVLPLV